jgi:hypothetical protein
MNIKNIVEVVLQYHQISCYQKIADEAIKELAPLQNAIEFDQKRKEGIKALHECFLAVGLNNFTQKGYDQFAKELKELSK